MSLTATEKEVYDHCDRNDFIAANTIKNFKQRLAEEGNESTLSYAMEKFIHYTCPKCDTHGVFKWHFFGKLIHPACSMSWYVDPGTYIFKSIKDIFRTGFEAGGEVGFRENGRGESGGIFGFIFGFIFGVVFRTLFAMAMIPIQAVVSITQKNV